MWWLMEPQNDWFGGGYIVPGMYSHMINNICRQLFLTLYNQIAVSISSSMWWERQNSLLLFAYPWTTIPSWAVAAANIRRSAYTSHLQGEGISVSGGVTDAVKDRLHYIERICRVVGNNSAGLWDLTLGHLTPRNCGKCNKAKDIFG